MPGPREADSEAAGMVYFDKQQCLNSLNKFNLIWVVHTLWKK
jgi:hypothetical protein